MNNHQQCSTPGQPPLQNDATVVQPSIGPAPADWRQRADQFHEQQWALAQGLLAAGRRILLNHLGQGRATTSLAQVEKLLRLANKLGQVSSQLSAAQQDPDALCPKCCAHRLAMEAALDRIYGKALPGEQTGVVTPPAIPKPGEAASGLSTLNP